ncbi:MAG: glycosyltransferase family 4 protein [Candidatus Yanofskybacteria bacterium]|nr:glycosyltransferase family 4 protein [Candidatus Yanofskybacteria bacterium]
MIIGVDIRVLGTGRMSGIEEYTEQLLAHMVPLDAAVQWKFFFAGTRPLARRSWMELPNARVYDTRISNRLLWARTWLTGRPHLDALVGGADVFFFPHFILGALSRDTRRVMTWHDLSYERMPELLSWHRRRWHDLQMRPRAQALASDHLIAVSRATADDMTLLYGIPSERVSVVHSGIDAQLRRASEQDITQWRERQAIDGPFVLALGTREPRKNLVALVKAWDAMQSRGAVPRADLVLLGPDGWREDALWRAIRATKEPRRVHCIGPADAYDRACALSAASVLAYPSLLEGFGFPPLEAMACGTPVVVGATSSLFEVVGDAGILVDPYRVDSLTRALEAVLGDAGLRSHLAAKGFERATHFTWRRAAEETLKILIASAERGR